MFCTSVELASLYDIFIYQIEMAQFLFHFVFIYLFIFSCFKFNLPISSSKTWMDLALVKAVISWVCQLDGRTNLAFYAIKCCRFIGIFSHTSNYKAKENHICSRVFFILFNFSFDIFRNE